MYLINSEKVQVLFIIKNFMNNLIELSMKKLLIGEKKRKMYHRRLKVT